MQKTEKRRFELQKVKAPFCCVFAGIVFAGIVFAGIVFAGFAGCVNLAVRGRMCKFGGGIILCGSVYGRCDIILRCGRRTALSPADRAAVHSGRTAARRR